eukprot:TRINITY_DN25352_c0_g1_i1.p1 TRINITY_DN25352_c0_g1~~TRINITY_DN25352_c0_g1_i1.p1  ORF type:complete len:322 (+),score=44.22 TRINITY_DN25352_c0_g1_i1:144-1109(+)
MASNGPPSVGATLIQSEVGSDAAPVVCCDIKTFRKTSQVTSKLPCMVVLMLPALWQEVPELSSPSEPRFLPVLVAKESVEGFKRWWEKSSATQKMDICAGLFHGAVDKIVLKHTVPDAGFSVEHADRCIVCQEDFQPGETVEKLSVCGHTFHGSCIRRWLRQTSHCPLCREHVGVTSSPSCCRYLENGRETEAREAPDLAIQAATATTTTAALEQVVGATSLSPPPAPPAAAASTANSSPSNISPRAPVEGDVRVADEEIDTAMNTSGSDVGQPDDATAVSLHPPPATGSCQNCGCRGMHAYFRFCPYCGATVNELSARQS